MHAIQNDTGTIFDAPGAHVQIWGYDPLTFDPVLLSSHATLQAALDAAEAGQRVVVNDASVPVETAVVSVGQLIVEAPAGVTVRLTLADPAMYLSLAGEARFQVTGGPGSNMIFGALGNDTINGGGGHDFLEGFIGNDVLHGGAGNDTLLGMDGNDTIWGGIGHDEIMGDNGRDRLSGDAGNDTIWGGAGIDTLSGGDGADLLYGDGGNDLISGDGGADALYGGGGNDTLDGGFGADRLFGGAGNDVLIGGRGTDTMLGGAGTDRFVFTSAADTGVGAAADVIREFQSGIDVIDLSAVASGLHFIGAAAFTGVAGEVRYANGRVGIDLDGDRIADAEIRMQGAPVVVAGDFDVIL
ncbi:calcium-binding protein [Ruixingdingia sedimenti]|uniref:Calcium-binding protein n=1 Tax=Ruixingdingia sedimenti TaxID=3073604 RepID=A0ABU1F6W1_9RHOB|nr:calcium-binding protein [Xinfangfangia sp. LG-4]MDR5652616.1 calcium-binding protein [Xinfangfangia sp. LG-4]